MAEAKKKTKKPAKVADVEEPKEVETPEVEETKTEKKPKKKRGLIKKIMLFLSGLVLAGVLWLGWLGFIPVLSNLLGAHNARDLGVVYTEADLASFYDRTSQEVLDYDTAPFKANGHRTIFANPTGMDMTISQEEMTARINDLSEWIYMPMSNVQVAFGDDNVIEVSGNLITDVVDEFVSFIGGVGYSDEDVQTGLDWLGRFAGDPAVYVKTEGTMSNNQLSLKLIDAKIGRWTPPLGSAEDVLTTGVMNIVRNIVGLYAESTTFTDGELHFDGTVPTTVYVKNR